MAISAKACQFILSRLNKTGNILDIGCGSGYLCNYLARELKKPIVGLDVSSKGFEEAHDLCQQFDTCHLITCLSGKVEKLEEITKDKKLDNIIFAHSFHHVDNVRIALDQSKKVLSKNGQIMIAEYSREKGREEDNCKRFSIKFIIDLLIKKDFQKITVEQIEKGFFLIIARNYSRLPMG